MKNKQLLDKFNKDGYLIIRIPYTSNYNTLKKKINEKK